MTNGAHAQKLDCNIVTDLDLLILKRCPVITLQLGIGYDLHANSISTQK